MLRAKSPQAKNILSPQRISPVIKKNTQQIANKLNQLLFKKMRFTFQVLKQFFLFPEGSSSSVTSIEKYDKLIFNDEAIHTLAKKLETKVLERKIWAFLNIKMMRVLKKVNEMTQKVKRVVKRKQSEFISFGFQSIKVTSIRYAPPKKKTRDSASQTKIQSPSKISSSKITSPSKITASQNSQTRVDIGQTVTYRLQPRVYVHTSRSRSRSISPNNSYSRITYEDKTQIYPSELRANVRVHEVSPQKVIVERMPAQQYYEQSQVQNEYRNYYRVVPSVPTRVRIVSCGCEHLIDRSCSCTRVHGRVCGCNTCQHSCCNGCSKCNCCHSHCSCSTQPNRSCSREQKSIKIIKSPSKKIIEQRPPEIRNNYLNHLEGNRAKSPTYRFEYTQTRVTQIRRV